MDFIFRWFITVLCAIIVGMVLGTDYDTSQPGEISLWDKIQVLLMFFCFTAAGWEWASHFWATKIARREVREEESSIDG